MTIPRGDALLRVVSGLAPLVTAALVHPGGLSFWPGSPPFAAAFVVFVSVLVVLRAFSDRRYALLALGGIVVVAGLGWDAAAGFRGAVRLREGETTRNLEEEGPGAGSPALRPLGFEIGFQGMRQGRYRFVTRAGTGFAPLDLGPGTGETMGRVRLGAPRMALTGGSARDAESQARVMLPVAHEPGSLLAGLGLVILAAGCAAIGKAS